MVDSQRPTGGQKVRASGDGIGSMGGGKKLGGHKYGTVRGFVWKRRLKKSNVDGQKNRGTSRYKDGPADTPRLRENQRGRNPTFLRRGIRTDQKQKKGLQKPSRKRKEGIPVNKMCKKETEWNLGPKSKGNGTRNNVRERGLSEENKEKREETRDSNIVGGVKKKKKETSRIKTPEW